MASSSNLHAHRTIGGIETEVVIQSFADSVLVLVTQLGKVGNLIQATIPSTSLSDISAEETVVTSDGEFSMAQPFASIELVPLLGSAPSDDRATLHSLYASQIATIVWRNTEGTTANDASTTKKVVVGIALNEAGRQQSGLTDSARNTFLCIMKMVTDLTKAATRE